MHALRNPSAHPLLLILLGLTLAAITVLSFNQAQKPGDLPPPTTTIVPSPEHLPAVLAIAQSADNPLLTAAIKVNHRDRKAFWLHLQSAAFQRGWYIYKRPHGGYGIVLPAREIRALQNLQNNPVSWVLSHTQNPTNAKGPSHLDLVHVKLSISRAQTLPVWLWTMLTILGTGATVVCILSGVCRLLDGQPRPQRTDHCGNRTADILWKRSP